MNSKMLTGGSFWIIQWCGKHFSKRRVFKKISFACKMIDSYNMNREQPKKNVIIHMKVWWHTSLVIKHGTTQNHLKNTPNQPKLPKTTQNKPHNHPEPATISQNYPQLPKITHNYSKLLNNSQNHSKSVQTSQTHPQIPEIFNPNFLQLFS